MRIWIKVLVAGALLALLISGVDWGDALSRLDGLKLPAVFGACCVLLLQFPTCAVKWRHALRLHDVRLPRLFLLRVHCIAFFLNNFLPTGIGGDAYRVYRTVPAAGETSRAISAVLLDRVAGFGALLALGALGALWLSGSNAFARSFLLVVVLAGAGGLVMLLAAWRGWFRPVTTRLRRFRAFQAVEENLRRVLRIHPAWASLVVGSFAFQILAAAWVYFVFASIDAPLPVAACVLISAASGIASVLPISISGIGVVEGAIAGAAMAVGLPYEAAVLGALLNRLGVVPFSAACGLVYLFERRAHAEAAVPQNTVT